MNSRRLARATAAALALGAIAAPATASAHPARTLVLRAEGEELVKVGSPAQDYTTGFFYGNNGEDGCDETGVGKLESNEQRVDVVAFSSATEVRCSEGSRILAGRIKEVKLAASGAIKELADWTFETPGDCVYTLDSETMRVTYPYDFVQGTLAGSAKLLPQRSAAGCAATLSVHGAMDLTDVERETPPYTGELG